VSFVPDVFGLTGRRVEEQAALAEQQTDELAAAQLAVTGNAVTQALTIASIRLQIDALNEIVADDEKNLALVQQKHDSGKVDRTDVLLAQAQLESDRTALPPLEQQMAAAEDALATLVGKSAGEWTPPAFALDEFTLPPDLPLSLPSALVHQRPDILAAEAELHASSARIGVAVGQLYPTIMLSAALDPTALTPGALFEGSNLDWNILSAITAPLFHGGALRAQKQAALDSFRSSLATYRETVLQSLRQVADVLHALDHDTELVKDERRALDATGAALDLQRQRYTAGRVDLIRLLDAERSYQQARVGYARARAQRYLDSAALFVALGGGWCQDPSGCGDTQLSSNGRGPTPVEASSTHGDHP
jgi:NodT family efflux transporter outer membrane factor (OMF) lipoprotein